jgi:hypothetical protein
VRYVLEIDERRIARRKARLRSAQPAEASLPVISSAHLSGRAAELNVSTPMALEILERRAGADNADDRYVFSNHRHTCVADRAKKAAAILCKDGVSCHFRAQDLRRTAASYTRLISAPMLPALFRSTGYLGRRTRPAIGRSVLKPSTSLKPVHGVREIDVVSRPDSSPSCKGTHPADSGPLASRLPPRTGTRLVAEG